MSSTLVRDLRSSHTQQIRFEKNKRRLMISPRCLCIALIFFRRLLGSPSCLCLRIPLILSFLCGPCRSSSNILFQNKESRLKMNSSHAVRRYRCPEVERSRGEDQASTTTCMNVYFRASGSLLDSLRVEHAYDGVYALRNNPH
jgi:hypothetical protein